jgi:hypothetical protein
MNKSLVKCAECECTPRECRVQHYFRSSQRCINCVKRDSCCFISLHTTEQNACCDDDRFGSCDCHWLDGDHGTININKRGSLSSRQEKRNGLNLRTFFLHAKSLYVAALGIEILFIQEPSKPSPLKNIMSAFSACWICCMVGGHLPNNLCLVWRNMHR